MYVFVCGVACIVDDREHQSLYMGKHNAVSVFCICLKRFLSVHWYDCSSWSKYRVIESDSLSAEISIRRSVASGVNLP